MNASVMHNVEHIIAEGTRIAEEEAAVRRLESTDSIGRQLLDGRPRDPNHVEPIAKLLQRIDDTDLIKAHDHYAQLLDQSSQEILSRMRHRADMLRRRAQELDEEADHFENKQSSVRLKNSSLLSHISEIENILHSLAHIEPQRV